MSVIAEIRREREDLARVLKKHKGLRKIVEDIYPDSAHFIYELLQNAEDTRASKVCFILFKDHLLFEHDGRPFNEDDIKAITNIGEGTGKEDVNRISRFGVGFKSVFAYTETPHIWSQDFSFKISEFVLPWEIEKNPSLGEKTLFKFYFDNTSKLPPDAFEETRIGLEAISENTLLFISNIKSISWQVGGRPATRLSSIVKPKFDGEIFADHIEILMERDGEESRSSHFLRFSQPIDGMGRQFTAIAFKLDASKTEGELIENTLFADEFKISPTNPGRVSAFFTLEKEHSGLCFHIHAPFVTTPDRASIKETRKNDPLFEQLAQLAARSLSKIRDLQLLNPEFLAVLPNDRDELTKQYKCIREEIIGEMNGSPLTPTYRGKHKPAKKLLQAKASLKSLLKPKDIKLLVEVDYGEKRIDWAIGATQRNSRQDRFLSSLDIREWGIAEFQKVLKERLDPDSNSSNPDLLKKNLRNSNRMSTRERLFYAKLEIRMAEEEFLKRLKSKSTDWHQQFYALLFEELSDPSLLSNCWIVRLSSGEYEQGINCYFPTENGRNQEDHSFRHVCLETYTSGNSKKEKSNAKRFLEAVGVCEIGEREQIEAVLQQRYSRKVDFPDDELYKNDLTRFIAFVEENFSNGRIFANCWILKGANNRWLKSDEVYFDSPYLETGLHVFYESLGDDANCVPLSSDYYEKLGISRENIVKFGKASGVISELKIKWQSTSSHQNGDILRNFPDAGVTNYCIDQDYTINHLDNSTQASDKKISAANLENDEKSKGEIYGSEVSPERTPIPKY